MLKTKTMDRVCCAAVAVMIAISLLLWGAVEPVRGDGSHTVGYENLLFDKTVMHTIDITMDDWESFISNAAAEEYTECNISIDGEKYNHVAIRAKGNTSLSSVATLGSTRYSFKIEFNHFVKGMSYHGLDKLSLNNMIQDATMMKDYLAYTLMGRMGVPSSLCSYVQINVNGEPWGLYLAVEGVEDSFMDRNGMTKGELYKPDSLSFGGGRGNGGDFDIEKFRVKEEDEESAESATVTDAAESTAAPDTGTSAEQPAQTEKDDSFFSGSFVMPDSAQGGMPGNMPAGGFAAFGGEGTDTAGTAETSGTGERRAVPQGQGGFPGMPEGSGFGGFGGFNFGMGNDDVKLIYSDDDPDSYSNIFNNAKTKINTKDKTRLIESIRKLNEKEDIESVVNTDEVINYLAVHNFLCNDDSYTGMMVHNYYLYEEKGKLSIIPWDYNLGFGGFSASTDATSTVNSPIDSPVSGGTTDSRPLIAWVFSNEETLEAYHEAYDRFITENIESGWLAEEISRVQEMIAPYAEKDESAFYSMEEFNKAVETLQTFCAKRGESIRGQLDGTIPSTSEGQRQSDTLIDASDISIADMGSMNTGNTPGGGGGFSMPDMGSRPNMGFMPDMGTMPEGMAPPEGFSMPEGFTMPEGLTMPGADDTGGFFGGSAGIQTGSIPEMQQPAGTEDAETATEQPGETAEAAEPSGDTARPERPQGMPEGMDFPGMEGMGQADRTGQWMQLGIWSAVLLAALLIIRRAGSHNQ